MRRNDRQITDFDSIYKFVSSHNTLRLGLFDNEYPYIVPLSYGFEYKDDTFIFYVHSAEKGKKVNLISSNPKVCVEIDENKGFVELCDGVTTDYQSFIGFGTAYLCNDEEKIKGLDLLMKNCGFEGFPDGKCNILSVTKVYKIVLKNFTCKKRFIGKEAAN